MKIVGYQIFLRITRFVILVIRPDYQKFCLRSTPVSYLRHRPGEVKYLMQRVNMYPVVDYLILDKENT